MTARAAVPRCRCAPDALARYRFAENGRGAEACRRRLQGGKVRREGLTIQGGRQCSGAERHLSNGLGAAAWRQNVRRSTRSVFPPRGACCARASQGETLAGFAMSPQPPPDVVAHRQRLKVRHDPRARLSPSASREINCRHAYRYPSS